jgi:hypothetical protein
MSAKHKPGSLAAAYAGIGVRLERLEKENADLRAALQAQQGSCNECGKKQADGWALYCVGCGSLAQQGEPLAWGALNMNGRIVYQNESRANVEMNQRYIKTPTRVVGLVAQQGEATLCAYPNCACIGGTTSTCAKQQGEAKAPAHEIEGLGRITNEDDGYLTLQFKDEDAAQAFMQQYKPTVDVRDMPELREDASATLSDAFKEQFNKLLLESGNAHFECGEWDNNESHDQTYDVVLVKSDAADLALREFVFGAITIHGEPNAKP